TDYKSLISYYLREGFYQHAANEATEQIQRRGNDTYLLYWEAFALGMEGLIPEAIRKMENLRSKHDVELGVAMALLYFHGKAKMVDREAVETLTATLTITEDMAGDGSVLTAARFQWLIGDLEYARKLVTRVQGGDQSAQTPIQQQAFALRGWIDASIRQPQSKEEVILLKESIRRGSGQLRDLDTVMGKARYFGSRLDGINAAADHLSHAIALEPRFWPALVEKARLWAAVGDWEQAEDAIARVLAMDDDNVPALMLHALQGLTQAGQDSREGIDRLRRLSESLSKREPRNTSLHLKVSKPFARVCGRDPVVLQLTIGMLESVRGENVDLLVELGYQLSLSGAFDAAVEAYQAGARANEGDVRAMTGVVYCQVQDGDLEEAAQQLEFLTVMQDSIGSSPEISLVRAMLKFRFDRRQEADSMDQHLSYLDECAELHESRGKNTEKARAPSDPLERLCLLNPDMMLEIAKEYLLHAGSEAGIGGSIGSKGRRSSTPVSTSVVGSSQGSSPVSKGLAVLRKVVGVVPGHLGARLLMARAFYSTGQEDLAHQTLQALLAMDPAREEAHLLAAQVHLAQGRHRAASNSLEQALSFSFRVGKNPVFLLVKASVQREEGELEGALETFEEALRLPSVREGTLGGSTSSARGAAARASSSSSSSSSSFTGSEKAAIFSGAVGVLAKLKRTAEANELVKEAMAMFRGTPDEVQIVVANSELAIERGDFDKALHILGDIPPESPSYVRLQSVKATIYLTLRRDKRAYAQCYRDMAQTNPSAATYVLLGEAYMRIQMPEAAIESFEMALDMDPSDSSLAGQIGRALVSTHDYRRAVEYYRKALRGQPRSIPLRHDLARLCLKLGRFEDASGVLREALSEDSTDLEDMKTDVQTLLIMAEVSEAASDDSRADSSLTRAGGLQETILARSRSGNPDVVREEKVLLSKIAREQARFSLEVRNDDGRAIECYSASLKEDEGDEESMVGLAKTHLRRNELDQCERLCETALRVSDGKREEASMILAEVMFLKTDHAKAIQCYRAVLEQKPNNYKALQKLVGLLRRAGQLNEVSALLELAKAGDPRSSAHAGLRFCSGLYHRYINDVHEAVRQFNRARRDGEWGVRALEHLVEIYVSPNGDHLWEVAAAAPGGEGSAESLGTARFFLSELQNMSRGNGRSGGGAGGATSEEVMRRRYLESVVKMMGRDKEGIDAAIAGFVSMLEDEKDCVPALLGMSLAFTLEDSPNKARNALKRIAKMPYTLKSAEEFEQAYLHLAHLYVDRGKFDLAQDLCRRCLTYNKSCSQAWEALGLVMEKEQSYRDAAECYEKSWEFGNQAGAAGGFKLAFNYLKAKRFVEAIDVCNKVLAQYPDYPKIREEILCKAQESLRP
ncbi:unnamed protein product, partial [Pylaiella littoralis]